MQLWIHSFSRLLPSEASSALSFLPAPPTKGRPSRASSAPGASPTIAILALAGPSPRTNDSPTSQSGQPVHVLGFSNSLTKIKRKIAGGSAVVYGRNPHSAQAYYTPSQTARSWARALVASLCSNAGREQQPN